MRPAVAVEGMCHCLEQGPAGKEDCREGCSFVFKTISHTALLFVPKVTKVQRFLVRLADRHFISDSPRIK